jgi:hypothetical protein
MLLVPDYRETDLDCGVMRGELDDQLAQAKKPPTAATSRKAA